MGEVQVSWRLEAGDGDAARRLVAHPFGAPVVGGMVQTQGGRLPFGDGAVNLAEEGSSPVWASAAAFAQANAEQDSALRRCVAEWAEPRQARVLELFAGVGNLTRGLAGEAREVVAVESSPVASDILERNAAVMGGTVRVLTGEAEAVLQGLVDRGERFEIVVLDPPREGCPSLAPLLAKLGASRVVYVSCDPMTLARDLRLLAREGFRTARARAVDMMPQTFHVEGLALASR
jgi:23S rRNA (uracil1939-C5)-methyltransferase